MRTKLDIGVAGQNKKSGNKGVRSLEQLLALIDERPMQFDVKEELIKMARGYPEGSLDYFYNNINNFIGKCQKKINIKNRPEDFLINDESPKQELTKQEPPKQELPKEVEPFKEELSEKKVTKKRTPEPKKGKWDVVSSSEIKKQQEEQKRAMLEEQHKLRLEQQQQANKDKTGKIEIEPENLKWTPSDNEELEEFRRKLKYLHLHKDEIQKQVEEERKKLEQ